MNIEQLARVPIEALPPVDITESVQYLGSDAAVRSLERDAYWPKWDSPWWHMLLLWELGEARQIPLRAVRAMVAALDALPVKTFPIDPSELPAGNDPWRQVQCHCALGSMYQVLTTCGVDVDRELPWMSIAWFARYQMADGGLSCDNDAYLVADECPSSMVGTVAPLEAMLHGALVDERATFVDRAAAFLVARELVRGSSSAHNAEERARESEWRRPCFPRFYLYDVLRGLHVLSRWAVLRGRSLPAAAIESAVETLLAVAGDGVVRVERRAHDGIGTRVFVDGGWQRESVASSFALLDATSVIGAPSVALTRQWADTRTLLLELAESNRLT
jgi:hypothetical protein